MGNLVIFDFAILVVIGDFWGCLNDVLVSLGDVWMIFG